MWGRSVSAGPGSMPVPKEWGSSTPKYWVPTCVHKVWHTHQMLHGDQTGWQENFCRLDAISWNCKLAMTCLKYAELTSFCSVIWCYYNYSSNESTIKLHANCNRLVITQVTDKHLTKLCHTQVGLCWTVKAYDIRAACHISIDRQVKLMTY